MTSSSSNSKTDSAVPDHYHTLGVSKTASANDIRVAFRRQALALHPDTSSKPNTTSNLEFAELRKAYEILQDPEKKREYDAQRGNQPSHSDSAAYSSAGAKLQTSTTAPNSDAEYWLFRRQIRSRRPEAATSPEELQSRMAKRKIASKPNILFLGPSGLAIAIGVSLVLAVGLR